MSEPGQFRLTGGDPVVRAELQRILDEHGGRLLEAQHVVDAARPRDSLLHGRFVWDDTEAAERYRLGQAQQLIRSVKVISVSQEAGVESAHQLIQRAYHSAHKLEAGPSRSYLPTLSMTAEQRAMAIIQMRREVEAVRRRFGHMQEFWQLLASLEPPEDMAAASGQ